MKWRVEKHGHEYRLYNPQGAWHDTFPSHKEAMTWAARFATWDAICDGGLVYWKWLYEELVEMACE